MNVKANLHSTASLSSMPTTTGTSRRGYTLIEILIVVIILGVLAGIVVPQFANASTDASDTVVRTQLHTIRQQIEIFRAENGTNPRLVAKQWDDLVLYDYLMRPPVNPLNGSSLVKGSAKPGTGWVWRPSGTGGKQLFATDETTTSEYVE